ncbi:MAG: amidohydrolase family protein [Candidatus Heimdallarchaeota archaeon]
MNDAVLTELFHEMKVNYFISELSRRLKPENLMLKGVHVIPLAQDGRANRNSDITIKNGIITSIESHSTRERGSDFRALEFPGKYVIPGLVDAHVHMLSSNRDFLLNLVNGITTIREMCGFPWLLNLKRAIQVGKFLAPDLFVGGHMLNYEPFNDYTTVVRTEHEVKRAIDKQHSLGYDFIKVWNHMPLELLRVIGEYAHQKGLTVSAHIPHGITVKQAVEAGIRSFEHFKGYLDDRTIKLTEEDYVQETPTKNVWNCPTFITFKMDGLIGEEAISYLNQEERFNYISPYERENWEKEIKNRTQQVENLKWNIPKDHYHLQVEIFQSLLQKEGIQFLCGTDLGGGAPLSSQGFGLIDEIEIMNSLGLRHLETLRAATVNPAKVLQADNEFGKIAVNMKANLVILNENPLETLDTLKRDKDIVIRGIYISDSERKSILESIKGIYKLKPLLDTSTKELTEALLEYYLSPENRLYLKPPYIRLFAEYLNSNNMHKEAGKLLKINLRISNTFFDYKELARHYERLGSEMEARKYYSETLAMNPYDVDAQSYVQNHP